VFYKQEKKKIARFLSFLVFIPVLKKKIIRQKKIIYKTTPPKTAAPFQINKRLWFCVPWT